MSIRGNLDIQKYFRDVQEVAYKLVDEQAAGLERIIGVLFAVWKDRRQVFVFGNGGSASTATHFAADLFKTVNPNPEGFGIRALALADNIPLASALTNDWGWENVYIAQLRTLLNPRDVVVAFSVHGGSGEDKAGAWSQNILKGLQYAKDHGAITIGFSGFDGGAMKDLADICIVVPAGSTPLVESFHSVIAHLITFRLKELIADENSVY